MDSPIAETTFDCVGRDGQSFVLHVRIGDRHDIPTKSGDTDVGFYIELDPLMERRHQGGPDTFTALCFSIRLVRKALKIFTAHGGSVYFVGTRCPIDLDSSWFESLGGLIRDDYLMNAPNSAPDVG